MKLIFKKRRNLIVKLLNNIPHINCAVPGGAFYVFPDFSYYISDTTHGNHTKIESSTDLSMYLLSEVAVVTVAGDSFGAPLNIRFSYALSESDIEESIHRVDAALKKLLF